MNFAVGYDVSSLPAYVEQNRDILISQTVMGADSLRYFRKMTGVKGKAAINLMDLTPTVVCGTTCGFSAGNAVALTQKEIQTCYHKVNLEFCPEQMANTYAEWAIEVGARKTEFPFEQYFAELLRDRIRQTIENEIWMGVSGFGCCNGLLAQASPDMDCSCPEGGMDGFSAVMNAYLGLRAKYSGGKGINIFVDPVIFDAFCISLVQKNLFHYDLREERPGVVFLPGTNARVINTLGLMGTNNIFAATEDNLVYATDMESNSEEFRIWYSDDADMWRVKVKWNGGATWIWDDEKYWLAMYCTPNAGITACAS